MNEPIAAIINMLNVIHIENMIIFSILTGEDENGVHMKKMQENFEKAYEGIVEK